MRLIDADAAAAFAENCGATFVAKRLRDGKAFPEAVTHCKDCKHLFGTLCMVCGLQHRNSDDFCSYGEPKEGAT